MAVRGVNGCLTRLNFLWAQCNTMKKQRIGCDSILGEEGVRAYRSIPFVRCLPSLSRIRSGTVKDRKRQSDEGIA